MLRGPRLAPTRAGEPPLQPIPHVLRPVCTMRTGLGCPIPLGRARWPTVRVDVSATFPTSAPIAWYALDFAAGERPDFPSAAVLDSAVT